ncbi:hypothetical protein RHS01_03094 [Rhizoctonia solani]|uniref:Uncharacterized protein n=1 Tax=Rhizoctonia solani TaxID=456999 RepID=A0A8H7IH02_9AGAM|nr:hypothetical protein RHS01_03094 [Rhizoctonia solani]
MSCDIKVQSALEHDRWMAHKSADRLKGKRVPRCACSWCASARIPSGRGGNGRVCARVDDHEIDGLTLGDHDVPLTALIREPRRRKDIRPTRAVLALDDDGFGVSNRHVGRDELEEWEDVGLVSEAKGPAKLVATSARSYAEVLTKA